jgi:hypothetical protein
MRLLQTSSRMLASLQSAHSRLMTQHRHSPRPASLSRSGPRHVTQAHQMRRGLRHPAHPARWPNPWCLKRKDSGIREVARTLPTVRGIIEVQGHADMRPIESAFVR